MRRVLHLVVLGLGLVLLVLVVAGAAVAKKKLPAPVTIQILNVSDWHGNLDPIDVDPGTATVLGGGAWNISARWKEDRKAHPTLTLTAGDDFGATPALSNFFNEEPAVKAQRLMGIQVNALGNHNFDRGVAHLQQMIDLAGARTRASTPGTPYKYVSANLNNLKRNLKGVEPVAYFKVGKVKVAVIGITNEEAPSIVLPGSFGTITVGDGVAAANKYAREARKKGADAVIVITHKGVRGVDASGAPVGELIDFAKGVDSSRIDVIFGDHTDIQFSGTINGILVHENRSFGAGYAKTLLTVQPGRSGDDDDGDDDRDGDDSRRGYLLDDDDGRQAGRVTSKSVTFVSPSPAGVLGSGNTSCTGGTPAPAFCDQAILDMLVPYRQQLAALLDEPLAKAAATFARGGNIERRQEVPLGSLMADGMRVRYGTQLGLMNSGGIRMPMPTCSYLPVNTALNRPCTGYGTGTPFDVVLGDIFSVLPFGNVLNTRTVTGAQLWTALENGVSRIAADGTGTDGRFPQISGFKFSFRHDVPTGCGGGGPVGSATEFTWTFCAISRVQSVQLSDGTAIPNSTSATYTLALPNFTNLGGDSYFMFADGQGATQELDAVVMKTYIESFGATPADRLLNPASFPLDRITKCNGACP